ncbi:MAG TPA: paraquat-inducible protein A [Puia sp.]|nr:paraquat-inducible protein A [Puia sp.]
MNKETKSKAGFGLSGIRILLVLGVSIILFGMGYCGLQVYILSNRQEHIKKDYMIVNSVSFGLLSVDEWRDNLVAAAKGQIQKFKLTPQQNSDLKKEIEVILNGVIDKASASINKPQKSVGGKIKKLAFNTLVNEKKLHEEVPGYAQKIIDEVNKPSSYNRLKRIAQTELDSLGSQTYDSSKDAETVIMDSIFKKYNTVNKDGFENQTNADLSLIRKQTYTWALGMLAGVILILILWWLVRHKEEVHTPLYVMSIFSAVILLVVGLNCTMIQIDARISSMDFHLLGQDVQFKNQVLFFQSKSIVDVVRILIKTGKIDSMIVGVLILVFSIIFPITKLLSTGIYMLNKRKWAKNKVIHFFAFDSGKWSMADVFVIAILMTYIGFNGIVNSTLSDLNLDNGTITSITTNNTSIQPGYIIFIGFVLYGLTLSSILKNITHLKHIIIFGKKKVPQTAA